MMKTEMETKAHGRRWFLTRLAGRAAVAHIGQAALAHVSDVHPVHEDATRAGPVETGDDAEQGAVASGRRAR